MYPEDAALGENMRGGREDPSIEGGPPTGFRSTRGFDRRGPGNMLSTRERRLGAWTQGYGRRREWDHGDGGNGRGPAAPAAPSRDAASRRRAERDAAILARSGGSDGAGDVRRHPGVLG